MMTTFYLIRHGDKNREAGDPALSELGKQQAKKTARHLTQLPINAIYSSPLLRTKQTAFIIAKELDLTVVEEEALKERMNWELPNQSFEEFVKEWNYATLHPDFKPSLGDSVVDTAERIQKVIKKLAMKHTQEQVVLITHGGAIKDFISTISKKHAKLIAQRKMEGIRECSITKVISDGETIKLQEIDIIDHLS